MSIKISGLPSGASSSGTDEFPATQSGTTQKFTLAKMAEYIVNGFNSLSLGGIAQTVKSAIDTVTTALSNLSDLVGNTAMGTTATTVTGAIAEHESDITSLNSSLNSYIVANNYTFPSSVSIAANNTYTNTDVDVSSAIPAGYTPVFAYCRATGENSICCYQCGMYNIAGKKAVIQLRNISASALNVTPVITVVSVKS